MFKHLKQSPQAPAPTDEVPPLLAQLNDTASKHEKYITPMMTDALMFKQALLALREVSIRLSKRFAEYGTTVFTNKADPDDEVAARGCQKMTEYLEGLARSLAICGSSVETVPVAQFKGVLDDITSAREAGRKYAAAHHNAEHVRRKYDSVSRKGAAQSAAQREIEAARAQCAAAEKEARGCFDGAAQRAALSIPHAFVAFYDLLGDMFRSGDTLAVDYRSYRDEFSDYCAAQRRAESAESALASPRVSSDGLSDEDGDGDGAANAEGLDDAVRRNAADSLELLADQAGKQCAYLAVYRDVLAKLERDLSGTKIAPGDVGRLAKAVGELHARQEALAAALAAAPRTGDVLGELALVVSDMPPALEEPYKRYFEAAPFVQDMLAKHQKNKAVRAAQKQYEQRGVHAGLAQEPWSNVVPLPARYPDTVLTVVRDLVARVPGEHAAWEPLKIAQERLGALCDAVREAKTRARHVCDLLGLRDRLPDEKNLVSAARVLCAEGNLVCIAATNAVASSSSSSSASSSSTASGGGGGADDVAKPALPAPLSPSMGGGGADVAGGGAGDEGGGVVLGHTYFTFLFTDMVLFCVPKKKGSPEKGYVAVQRLATRCLAFQREPSEKHALRLSHATGSLVLTAGSQADYDYWCDELDKAVTQRNQCVVFGVALERLMERTPELLVPAVLSDAAAYIEAHAKDAEGIFRISVSTTVLAELQETIDSGKAVAYTDAHCAANIVKAWLRALPEPLLTYGLYDAWIDAQSDAARLHDCVLRLPKHNRFVLNALVRLLKNISAYSDVTRMTPNNLAIVIAPNILYRRGDSMNISQGPTTVVDSLITDYDTIFRDTQEAAARTTELAKEVARSRRDTLRRRASASALLHGVVPSSSKKHLVVTPSGTAQAGAATTSSSSAAAAAGGAPPAGSGNGQLAALFVRAPEQDTRRLDVPPPAGPPPSSAAHAHQPHARKHSASIASPTAVALSSSQVSAAVSDLMRYTVQPGDASSSSSSAGSAPPAEFDLTGITLEAAPDGTTATATTTSSSSSGGGGAAEQIIPPPPLLLDGLDAPAADDDDSLTSPRSGEKRLSKSQRPRSHRSGSKDSDRRSLRHRSYRSRKEKERDAADEDIPPPPPPPEQEDEQVPPPPLPPE